MQTAPLPVEEIVAVDIGGTHARFAIAQIQGGRVQGLSQVETLLTGDWSGLEDAWGAYAARIGRPLPRRASVAIAGPVDLEVVRLTNNSWEIRREAVIASLGLSQLLLVNDFGAMAHATAQMGGESLRHVCGPDRGLPESGVVSVIGPGTGLGVALLITGDRPRVIETEGGHIGFAPADALQDAILADLRHRKGRISAERIVSGPGFRILLAAVAARHGLPAPEGTDKDLWASALGGEDGIASEALTLFCQCLGNTAGDIVLAQGSTVLVLAGGVTARIGDGLRCGAFADSFVSKGRFRERMQGITVLRITHAEPGLLGAAAALAAA